MNFEFEIFPENDEKFQKIKLKNGKVVPENEVVQERKKKQKRIQRNHLKEIGNK